MTAAAASGPEPELRILILEDVATEAELALRALKRAGVACTGRRVENEEAFVRELVLFDPDVILSDFSLPTFDGLSALDIAQRMKPDTPFIFFSGTIGEDTAVVSLLRGATDYVLKTNPVRLAPAIKRAVTERGERRARAAAERALRLTERAVEASPNPIVIGDERGNIVYVNPAFQAVTGYASAEVTGRNCRLLQGDDTQQPDIQKLRFALEAGHDGRALLRNYRKDGSMFWNDLYVTPVRDPSSKAITHFVGVLHDITETKRYQEQLERQAHYDALTGLANRNLLMDRLGQAIASAQRYGRCVLVALVDLDNFKLINNSVGHRSGDALLRTVAERLKGCVRTGDTVARLGSDEFVLVLVEQMTEGGSHETMERIQSAVGEVCYVDEHELRVTCSIGVSIYPHDAQDDETLLGMADAAMHRAKELGRNAYHFYTQEMTARIRERVTMESGLRRALERGEFFLHYQPQFELGHGKLIGMEALIRWAHPELGLVPPVRFIPLAEETGLIVPIGAWVLRTACLQAKALQTASLASLTVAVNLSARQFREANLIETVRAILQETELDPGLLELEITESSVMHDVDKVFATLAELDEMGIKLSLDDFGTGYSSLSYLKRFPVDRLKIDRSFVSDLGVDTDATAIVQSIIALGRGLQLEVLAEGVETPEQLGLLKEYGCDQAQGYVFCKPLPEESLREFIVKWRSSSAD